MHAPLYPLRFAPVFQYRLWGGRALTHWLSMPLPGPGPFGEAWILSDRPDCQSVVVDGACARRTLGDLMTSEQGALMGKFAGRFARFPLLLKFLDVRQMLSVQVHPSDAQTALLPEGERGKDEAWVVLEASPGSRLYAGLKSGVDAARLRELTTDNVDAALASFSPAAGQGVMIKAGTVHTLGDGLVVFEVQQNSDVTFRLYDWDHIDPQTNKKRPLQVEQALAAVDFGQGAIEPVTPTEEQQALAHRERLFDCAHFRLWRIDGDAPSIVGADDEPRVLVCAGGRARVTYEAGDCTLVRGDLVLLPAEVGRCKLELAGSAQILEIAIPA